MLDSHRHHNQSNHTHLLHLARPGIHPRRTLTPIKRLLPHRTRSCARHHRRSQEHKPPPPGTDPTPRNNNPQRAPHPWQPVPRGPCHAMPMSSLVKATRPSFWATRGPISPTQDPRPRPRIQTEERARRSVYSTGARGRTVQKRQGTRDEDAVAHPMGNENSPAKSQRVAFWCSGVLGFIGWRLSAPAIIP